MRQRHPLLVSREPCPPLPPRIVMIGDRGDNQRGMKAVAGRLNEKWAGGKTRVHPIPEYYNYPGLNKWLLSRGIGQKVEGLHDDFAVTAIIRSTRPRFG